MAKSDLRARTVLEPFSHFDISAHSRTSIRSIAVSSGPDSQFLIYIGTYSGSLLLLTTDTDSESNHDDDASKRKVSFMRSVSVGDSPVEAVLVLAEIEKVLVLCDGCLLLVDSLLDQQLKKLGFAKGVSGIAKRIVSSESDCSDLRSIAASNSESSTASQRILQRLGGGIRTNGVVKATLQQTEDSSNNVFAIVLGGKKIVLAELVFGSDSRPGKNEGVISGVNGSLVVLKEIQSSVEGVKAIAWLNDSVIAGTVNGYSIFSCLTGQSDLIFSLPDSSRSPLLKLLWKEKNVLLLVDNVGVVVNDHGQPVDGSLVFRGHPQSIGELSSYVIIVRDGKLELYHKKSGSCLQTVVFGGEGVGSCLIADKEGGYDKLITTATSTKVLCYRKVPNEEQIKDLLRKKNFKEAMLLVEELECEGEIGNEMLSFIHAQVGFQLLFDLHFEEAVEHFLQSETMQPSEIFPFILRDPNRWSLLVPRKRYWGLHPPPAPLEDLVDDGLTAIQRAIFLRKAGVDTVVDDEFLRNPPNRAEILEVAIKCIIRYLEVSREKELPLLVREGVDTLLMYLYRALNNVDDMEKLASAENNCIVEELETLLDESGHLRALAFLYASKGMSSKALSIWRILARNYSSGLWKDPAADNDLQSSPVNMLSGREIAATEASKILEDLSDQDLVLQHLGWISDVNPMLAVQVVTSGRRSDQLSPDEVIAAIDPKKVEILQRYLQWLIEDQDSVDTNIHTLYALSLAKSAIETVELETSFEDSDDGRIEVTRFPDSEKSLIFQSPVRERLQIFLQSSDLYDPEDVLELIEGSELWLEKAILYRKLGQEALVLQILALKLEDSEAAEQYCAEIGRPDAYMQLLDMYLDPQNGKEPMFNAAVRLLHNHGESLDPLHVLETLSGEMPLKLASETILRMLRARVHHHHQGKIVHNLSRAVYVDARLARWEERSRPVQINDETLCGSCHARLGTKLFAMYPDDTVVCYKCFRRQGESTSVSGRDFKEDVLVKPGWLVTR
ncbi:Vacuolar sorting protein 3 [Linum grandiflorum]